LNKVDKDEAEEGKVCCRGGDGVGRVERREGAAEAGERGGRGEIADFRGDLAGEEVFLEVVLWYELAGESD